MSIRKDISTLPDTKRTFNDTNNFSLIKTVFLVNDDFSIPIASIDDYSLWSAQLSSANLTPVHKVLEFNPENEEQQFNESTQDFSYSIRNGRYRQKAKISTTLAKHKSLTSASGANMRVVYADRNGNVYLTSEDGVNAIGFTTNRVEVGKFLFSTDQEPAFTILDIELRDSDELNVNGVIEAVTFDIETVDRLFPDITIDYIDDDTLNFTVSYNGVDVNTIGASDITITDSVNGALTFSLFSYLGGVYQLSGFSSDLTTGTISILSNLYLACENYFNVQVVTPSVTNYDFESGTNYDFEDGTNYDFND